MEMEVVFPGGKKVDAQYKGFTIRTDQSAANGGEGSAPAPFDLFLSSIGTCVGIYVLEFCRTRKIPTETLKLHIRFSRNTEKKMVEKAAIEIQLPKEFPGKYVNAIIRAAELCTVKKHLQDPPSFEIVTKTAD
ncbi:MAG: osmotically inducible protein OsmC [Chitinivibrionales bacterium]|nr:osmotically inducible protein OsmC [Chitinivibrionales bacterium]MBD3394842.1 osmotically inducible protein OsmC [Chitinivibrionales bacterium]